MSLFCFVFCLFVCFFQLYEVFDKTPYTFVDTPELLQELSEHLNTVTEFAVDLEVCSKWRMLGSILK